MLIPNARDRTTVSSVYELGLFLARIDALWTSLRLGTHSIGGRQPI
jgi:hypothetical protein